MTARIEELENSRLRISSVQYSEWPQIMSAAKRDSRAGSSCRSLSAMSSYA